VGLKEPYNFYFYFIWSESTCDIRYWCQLSSAGIWFLMFLYIKVTDFLKGCKCKTIFTSTDCSASMEICGLQQLRCSLLNVHRGNSTQFFSVGSSVAHTIVYFHKILYFTIWHDVTVFHKRLWKLSLSAFSHALLLSKFCHTVWHWSSFCLH
jgi:hypothetical protein